MFLSYMYIEGEDNICLMCDLLTSVLVAEHQSESPGNAAWPTVLVHVGSYFCTAWLVVWLWFAHLCTGFWIDSGWCRYAGLCLYACWSLLPYSLASCVVCSVLITCRVYQGTPGVTVWSCLCLYMLVTAATWPSQLCGCGLLASVQDFMPPAWNMQLSESCFFWYSVFIVLYLNELLVVFFLSFPKIYSLHSFSLWAMRDTRCFNTPYNVCVAVVTWVFRCSRCLYI